MSARSTRSMIEREAVANRPKHWVRCVTACNSRCLFCLDSDTPRNVYLPEAEIRADILRGRTELGAEKLILSGGEGSLHPRFPELIRYGREVGYTRVQTVTNGYRFADPEFFAACVAAGLDEITFSLHGHDAELHDRLTQTPGAFRRLLKGLMRAVRTPGMIVSIDVCINRQNVAVLDKIVELGLSLGVREYDLLHVIPQAAAFENREQLFYDVREHLPVLQRVFRLARHPGVVIWTNRFPVEFLEGFEDLIQDPHKMLDEVNGRRHQLRRYLDVGGPLDCRQPERCRHCFIEPFCTTTDRVVEAQRAARFEVWWVGDEPRAGEPLPFGCTRLGVRLPRPEALLDLALPSGAGVYAVIEQPGPLPPWPDDVPLTLVCETEAHLDAWALGALPPRAELEIRLNRATAAWMLAHRDALASVLDRVTVQQPGYEHMREAVARDVREPRAFFQRLALPIRVGGLPACQAPQATLIDPVARLDRGLFDPSNGRLAIRELARHHVAEHYRVKSVRCRDCRVHDRCDGLHINMIRDQGLGLLTPLRDGPEADEAERQLRARHPTPPLRLATGRPPEPPAPSLPGYAMPAAAPDDPLAVIAQAQDRKRERRRLLLARAGQPAGK